MNHERLKTFIAVAEKKSFSEAAKVLYITQPTITAQIKALEEELQTKLFERTTKKVEMTASANILLHYAKKIVHMSDLAKKEILEMENIIHGDLRLGCSLTIGEYILPEFLKTFKDAHPAVHMKVEIANSANIVHHLKDQLIDIGLVETPISDKQIIVERILKDELVLIAAPDYFPKHTTHITAGQLRDLPLIMREQGSGTREVVQDYLDKAGLILEDLNMVMEMGSTEAIKATVQSGLGVSFVSKNAVKKEQKLKLLKAYPVKGISLYRYFYIVIPKNRVMKSITEHFMKELQDILTDRPESNLIHLPAGNA